MDNEIEIMECPFCAGDGRAWKMPDGTILIHEDDPINDPEYKDAVEIECPWCDGTGYRSEC